MDEGVVERGVDVGNTEDELALADLGAERDGVLFLHDLLLGGLHPIAELAIQLNGHGIEGGWRPDGLTAALGDVLTISEGLWEA